MATRHQSRFASISLLYAHEMGTFSDEFLNEFLDEQKIRNEPRNFTISLFEGVLANQINIDNKLNSLLNKWRLNQIGAIERAILRLGAYELMFANTDAKVIISEAVALASELSTENSVKLVNAVLDKIAKNPQLLSADEVAKLNEILNADDSSDKEILNKNIKISKAKKEAFNKNIKISNKQNKKSPNKRPSQKTNNPKNQPNSFKKRPAKFQTKRVKKDIK